jgi:hypothetical protein
MKHYKDQTNKVFAYELDGSQDNLIPSDYIPITDEEAKTLSAENTRLFFEQIAKQTQS